MSRTELPEATTPTDGPFRRLTSCPRCDSRSRALAEVGGELRGRCLACGEDLNIPLAVESHSHLELVGRAGTAFRAVVSGDG